jgi:hypothetical protein
MVELASTLLVDSPIVNHIEVVRPNKVSAPPVSARRLRRTPASNAEVIASVKAAREVIGQHNKPVHVGTLFREISERGCVIDTPKPALTYGARLRDNRKAIGLTYLEGFGWWLSERPYPPANYMPSSVSRSGRHIV